MLETVGTQEYQVKRPDFVDRLAESYGDDAAAEIGPALDSPANSDCWPCSRESRTKVQFALLVARVHLFAAHPYPGDVGRRRQREDPRQRVGRHPWRGRG